MSRSNYMLETGMMNGMSATTFEPNGTLTRAQLVTVLYRHAGSPDVTGLPNPFADVAPQSWYAKAVIWAAANGVVKGTSAATFAPEDAITPRADRGPFSTRYNGEAVTGRPCSPPSRMRTRSPAMPLRPCSGPSAAA